MPIEFACQCGSRFRVDHQLAGRRARCSVCQQYTIIPAKSQSAPVMHGPAVFAAPPPPPPTSSRVPLGPPPVRSLAPPPNLSPVHLSPVHLSPVHLSPATGFQSPDATAVATADDDRMEAQIRYHQALTQSSASSPGRLQISHVKHWISFPLWPTLWTQLTVAAAACGIAIHWSFLILALPCAGLLWLYWWIQRAKFISGCINPAVVVSVQPPLVAVHTDLSMSPDGPHWNAVKVLAQPLGLMTGPPAHIGQRLATVATYTQGDGNLHWSDFSPVVVNCVTWNERDIARVFATLDNDNWRQLENALRSVPRPLSPGLYHIEL